MENNTNTAGEALDLNKLEALAKAATPGPWHITSDDRLMAGKETVIEGSAEGDGYFPHTADGQFVAAANPATILELIALARAGSAAPGGQQEEPVARLDLLIQVDNLCSQIENTLYAFRGDDEAIEQAKGAIAHAKKVAAPYRTYRFSAPLPTKEGAGQDAMSQAARDVLAERYRQVEMEGWTPAHDDEYELGELPRAAASYALRAGGVETDIQGGIKNGCTLFWPWPAAWWKPGEPRLNLVKAGALIFAEIERLDRAAQPKDTTDTGRDA